MIFVSIGTHPKGFQRLVDMMDSIAMNLQEQVVMQIGNTPSPPRYANYFRFVEDYETIRSLNKRARVVVCHGGAGAIITARSGGTPIVVVPRKFELHEHNDDNQQEFSVALQDHGIVRICETTQELKKTLLSSHDGSTAESPDRLIENMRNLLSMWDKQISRQGQSHKGLRLGGD